MSASVAQAGVDDALTIPGQAAHAGILTLDARHFGYKCVQHSHIVRQQSTNALSRTIIRCCKCQNLAAGMLVHPTISEQLHVVGVER